MSVAGPQVVRLISSKASILSPKTKWPCIPAMAAPLPEAAVKELRVVHNQAGDPTLTAAGLMLTTVAFTLWNGRVITWTFGSSGAAASLKAFLGILLTLPAGARLQRHLMHLTAVTLIPTLKTKTLSLTLHFAVSLNIMIHVLLLLLNHESGDWAGQVFSDDSTCSALASSCEDYVQNNPQAFAESYWAVNSLKVYSEDGSINPIQSSAEITPTPTAPMISTPLPSSSAGASVFATFSNITDPQNSLSSTAQPILGTSLSSGFPDITTILVTSGVTTETAAPTTVVQTISAKFTLSPQGGDTHRNHFHYSPPERRARRASRHLKRHISNKFAESS